MTLIELQERLGTINDSCAQIVATADAEKRDLTADERTELRSLQTEFKDVTEEIDFRATIDEQTKDLAQPDGTPMPDPVGPDPNETPEEAAAKPVVIARPARRNENLNVPEYARARDHKWGHRSFGEFAQQVQLASMPGGQVDPRLSARLAPTIYGNEGAGSEGGFAVPPDFRAEIMEKITGEETLLGMTDRLTTSSNSITVPVDETTPWDTSSGVLTYWGGEGSQMTQSKPNLQQRTVQLHKLYALVPVTEELLADAPAMDRYLRRKAPTKIDFELTRAIVQGTGTGQPLGVLNAGSTVSVAKETSQTADTVVLANITKMFSRMYAPYRNQANTVWIANQDVEPQFLAMVDAGSNAVYLGGAGWNYAHVSGTPTNMLLGKRVIFSQACETLGDKGDIFFAALGEYMSATKAEGIRVETSLHLWFDYDMMAFRFIFRVAGMPWLSAAISARDGSNTYGAFVTLAERA